MMKAKHLKRGTTYDIIGTAEIQTSGDPIKEGDAVTVYRSHETGKLWVRPLHEFYDGRFEITTEIEPAQSRPRDDHLLVGLALHYEEENENV